MSTPEIEEFDPTFLRLFAHASADAAARVAEALTPHERADILRRPWTSPPQGLRDWMARHGEGDETTAEARAQAVEEQWRAPRAGDFAAGVRPADPLPEVQQRVKERLGEDEAAWHSAFELLATGFNGDMEALLDAAARHETVRASRDGSIDPSTPVSWMIRIAPAGLRLGLLSRLASGHLRAFVSDAPPEASFPQALIDTGDREVWERLIGASYAGGGRRGDQDAVFESFFLNRDDPEVNEWLLTGVNARQSLPGYQLAPCVQLALLEGRPFGSGAPDPLPRTEAVHALIAGSSPAEPDLLRICYDSREPGLAAQALRASLDGPEELLTPYQQVVAAIRLWGTGLADGLLARAAEADGVGDPRVREAFRAALAGHSLRPLHEAAEAFRRDADAHLDEALRVWSLRLRTGASSYLNQQGTQAELVAASRVITGDRWYTVDWDLVRSRLADPDVRHHREQVRERYGVLLARADCPPDVVAAFGHPQWTRLDLLRLFADRDTAVTALTHGNLGVPENAWTVARAAVPRPGWEPAVGAEDVLRHAGPCGELLHAVPREVVGRALAEFLAREGFDTPAAEARLWLALRRLTPYFAGPLPHLLSTAARLAGGGEPLDVVPAAELLVGPGPREAAGLVRDRLGSAPGTWTRAVRLLVEGFDGTLPELLDAVGAVDGVEPSEGQGQEPAPVLHGAAAALLGLAPGRIADAVVGGLGVPARLVLVRTTRHADTVRALARHGDRMVWDALLDRGRVKLPSDPPYLWPYGKLRNDVVIPALLAQDDPWLNARLVREAFAWDTVENGARTSAILAGHRFGPGEGPVPVLPGLRADFAAWTPDSGAEPPRWTRNPYFYTSPEPVLALQSLMAGRKPNRVDPPTTQLDVRQSLLAASTIAHAGRFDLLEYAVRNWSVRYPYGGHHDVWDLFERAVRTRSAEEIDAELAAPR